MSSLSADLLSIRNDLESRIDELTGAIVSLAETNSGSFHAAGVNRVGTQLAELVARLRPDTIEHVSVPDAEVISEDGTIRPAPLGDALRVRSRPDAPFRVCLFGHLDTVFPADHDFQSVSVDGHRLSGPGVADCKGGLVLATEVARAIDGMPWSDHVGWELLVLPDEEIGSNSSKPLLGESAERCHLGIGFEPSLPSGGVAGARKGTLTAHTIVRGLAAHVGRAHHEGRSAILGLSRLIVELEALNQHPGVTVNTGRISGGGALNAVPDLAVASYNMRVADPAAQRWVERRFAEVVEKAPLDIDLVWAGGRPPKVRTASIDLLLDDVADTAQSIGLTIEAEDTGGCCDGNDLAAAGLPNVDSLGILGGDIHSSSEFADVASLPGRAVVIVEVIRRAQQRSVAGAV